MMAEEGASLEGTDPKSLREFTPVSQTLATPSWCPLTISPHSMGRSAMDWRQSMALPPVIGHCAPEAKTEGW